MSELPASAWKIRPYRPGDEAELVRLFERVNGRPLSPAHWRWKLKSLPSPVENVWLAVVDDRPIFQYAAIPIRYQLPIGPRTVMLSVDIMTDPEYQRQGILTQAGRQTYRLWGEAGIPFTFGLPNERWGTRTRAVGLEPLFPFQWLNRLLRPATAVAARAGLPVRIAPFDQAWNRYWNRTLPADPGLTITRVTAAGAPFDKLWADCAPAWPVSAVRDAAWVGWRYLAAPDRDYRLFLASRDGQPAGYAACRIDQVDGLVKGVLAECVARRGDDATRLALLRHVVDHLAAAGAQSVATLAIPETPFHRQLRRAGFAGRAAFTLWLAPYIPELPMAALRDRHNWQLFAGDFDVV